MSDLTLLKEYQHYDGDTFITFNIVHLDDNCVTVAVTNRGKTTIAEYDLFTDYSGDYFEYGRPFTKIYIEDFEDMEN